MQIAVRFIHLAYTGNKVTMAAFGMVFIISVILRAADIDNINSVVKKRCPIK